MLTKALSKTLAVFCVQCYINSLQDPYWSFVSVPIPQATEKKKISRTVSITTHTHRHFSKCYFSRKREKFRGPLYFLCDK